MDPEVIEISPPWKLKAKAHKRKEVACHEIIDLDTDEDRDDVVLIQVNKKAKGAISLGPSNAEQGSMHSAQTRKKVDSNNKGKDVSMMGGVQMGQKSKSLIDAIEDADNSILQSHLDNMDIHITGIKADNFQMKKNPSTCSGLQANKSSKKNPRLTGSCSSMGKVVDNEDVLVRYESFKKIDFVEDYSDHYYAPRHRRVNLFAGASSLVALLGPQPSPNSPKYWVKNIQNEWRILEESLPDTIFVRAYESRIDLLRAVIIGAEGTPYHDGLFFFDICFPSTYPNDPPLVHYHQKSYTIASNIYDGGRVCLSLLNTWGGAPNEMWVPGTSTMLQVLVSLQGLVFTAKPYYNTQDQSERTDRFYEESAIKSNEAFLIASLRYMVSTMEKPPKHFEDFVRGHFRKRARDILMACKAYKQGVHVGCLVRGGVQDLDDEATNNSWSNLYKPDLVAVLKILVPAFKQIGAKEAHDFICLTEN